MSSGKWVLENSGGYKRQEEKSPALIAGQGLYSFREMTFRLKMNHSLIKRLQWGVCLLSSLLYLADALMHTKVFEGKLITLYKWAVISSRQPI